MLRYKLKWAIKEGLCKFFGHNVAVDPQGYNYCERCYDPIVELELGGWYNPKADPIQDIKNYIQRDRDRMKLNE